LKLATGQWRKGAQSQGRVKGCVREHPTPDWILLLGLVLRYVLAIYSAESDTVDFASAAASMTYAHTPYAYLIHHPPGWGFPLGLRGRG